MALLLRRRGRSAGVLGFIGLVALGVVATFLALGAEMDAADEADARAADLAATRLTGAFEQVLGSVRGADVLALDGEVEAGEFDAFATGVVDESLYSALAYAEVVTAGERAAFEASGRPIRDTDGNGGFVTADVRDPAYAVAFVYPVNETTQQVVGFDLAGDPVRRAAVDAASDAATPVLSDRISTASTGRAGVSVVGAVRTPDGTTVGVVTSGLEIDAFVAEAGIDRTALEGFQLSMDGEVLTGSPTDGASRTFEVANRSFEVVVADPGGIRILFPVLVGCGTLALAVGVAVATRRDRRQQQRLARAAERSRGIADLGQRLTALARAEEVLDEVGRSAGSVVGARSAEVVVPNLVGPDPDPLTEACMARSELVVADGAADDGGAVAAPLVFSGGMCVGALVFRWSRQLAPAEIDEESASATTIAELTSRALERAALTEEVQTRAERLSSFARSLAGAQTSAEVRAAVRRQVPAIVGAATVELELGADDLGARPDDADDVGVVGPAGRRFGRLAVTWPRSTTAGATHLAVMRTAAEMVGQTLARTAATEQQHHVIVELQRDLLPEPPEVPGLDIAVAYQPAMTVVGLGGDFYDVVAHEGRVHLVIGDITGHGSAAVAAMAELTSVLHHQLVSDVPIDEVCAEADLILARRHVLATAQIVEIDLERDELRIINAGHPYPVVARADGHTELVRTGHRALLGLGTRAPAASTPGAFPFGPGDLLLLYTDGLVERRSRHVGDAMDDLATEVRAARPTSMQQLAIQLLATRRDVDDGTDDDVALLVVRRADPSEVPAALE